MTINWKEGNHAHVAELGTRVLTISVWWDSLRPRGDQGPRWTASVFGARFKRNFDTIEQAKAAAEREAKRLIAIASETLL